MAHPLFSGHMRRRNWGRVLRDILLLPPALLYILIEHVFWAAAKAGLHAASHLNAVHFLQNGLRRLPAAVVLPLFLIPEIISHVGGIWATLLLVRGKLLAATLVGLFVKGLAIVLALWIYQNCAPALLSIPWFARFHAAVLKWRDWTAQRTRHLRQAAASAVTSGRSRVIRRFSALRLVLAARLGLIRRRMHRRQPR